MVGATRDRSRRGRATLAGEGRLGGGEGEGGEMVDWDRGAGSGIVQISPLLDVSQEEGMVGGGSKGGGDRGVVDERNAGVREAMVGWDRGAGSGGVMSQGDQGGKDKGNMVLFTQATRRAGGQTLHANDDAGQ
jgi:hypothetical protein